MYRSQMKQSQNVQLAALILGVLFARLILLFSFLNLCFCFVCSVANFMILTSNSITVGIVVIFSVTNVHMVELL